MQVKAWSCRDGSFRDRATGPTVAPHCGRTRYFTGEHDLAKRKHGRTENMQALWRHHTYTAHRNERDSGRKNDGTLKYGWHCVESTMASFGSSEATSSTVDKPRQAE